MTLAPSDVQHNQRHGNDDHDSTFITQAAITAHTAASDPHPAYATDTDLSTHAAAADPHTGYVLESLLDAKGDLIVASADNTPAKLTVGADRAYLTADSAQAGGVKWVSGAWDTYTPADFNVTVGNGTVVAGYVKLGRLVIVRYSLVWGSTTSYAGNVRIGLPFSALATHHQVGHCELLDNGTRFYIGACVINDVDASSATVIHTEAGNSGIVNATNPHTWASGDRLVASITYESAA